MNRTYLLLSAFILSAAFLLGCSSNETCSCVDNGPSSSSVRSSSSGGGMEEQRLVKKTITLSLDSSYADIDVPTVYTKEDAANNLTKIDLVAHCGTDMEMGCKNNSIYKPYEIDLFWNTVYVGSQVFLYEIPPEKAEIFKTATRLSEIVSPLNDLIRTFNNTSGVKEISIVEGKAFLVYTEDEIRVVIIKKAEEKSVGLEVLLIPSN